MNEKIIVITGANGALGKNLALQYVEQGDRIIAIDLDDQNLAVIPKTKREKIHFYPKDLCQRSQRKEIFKEIIDNYKRIDIWINNAAIVKMEMLHETTLESMDKVMEINFNAYQDFTFMCYNYMRQKNPEGSIVNIASMAGHLSLGGISSYVASKHAVVGLTESLQQEIHILKEKIHVMLVCPAFFQSSLMKPDGTRKFPEQFDYLTSSASTLAEQVIKAQKEKKLSLTPDLGAKIMDYTKRLSPSLTNQIAYRLINKVLKNDRK